MTTRTTPRRGHQALGHALYLAMRSLAAAPWRTAVLVGGLAVALFLPLVTERAATRLESALLARAEASPILLGPEGDEFDLVMSALYFRGRVGRPVPWRLVDGVAARGDVLAIPLHVRHTAGGAPVVGTTPEYFDARRLTVAEGRRPALLGEAIVGAAVARAAGLEPGDRLRSDAANLYNLAGAYPLLLEIVGVLDPSYGPDDDALFVDVTTAWALDGLFHGHDEVTEGAVPESPVTEGFVTEDTVAEDTVAEDTVAEDTVAENTLTEDTVAESTFADDVTEASAALFLFTEIDASNRAGFHMHGEQAEAPLDAVLVLPDDRRAHDQLLGDAALGVLLPAGTADAPSIRAVRPPLVVRSLLEIVLRLRAMLRVVFLAISLSTAAFIGLVLTLSLRLRRDELRLLRRLGAGRARIAGLVGVELALIAALALGLALAAALAVTERLDLLLLAASG
ncbi:MAG: ABC transporter permease [Acidobacteriota bacterium]